MGWLPGVSAKMGRVDLEVASPVDFLGDHKIHKLNYKLALWCIHGLIVTQVEY